MTSERGITFDGTNLAPPEDVLYKNLANHVIIYTIYINCVSFFTGFLNQPSNPYQISGTSNRQEKQQQQQRLQVKEPELPRCYKTLGPGTLCSSAWNGVFSLLKTRELGLGVFVSTCSCVGVCNYRKYQTKYYHIQGGPQKPVRSFNFTCRGNLPPVCYLSGHL